MISGAIISTAVFYFILKYFKNANLIMSTVSITTSFLASYLTFCRSPFYALAYASNDIVLIILWIMGLFDRIFIDWYWVGHTKAWLIPKTEDLQPYIPAKTLIKKWVGTIIGYPIIAAIIAGIMTLIV